MKAFCQFLCDPSLLKGYGIFFQGGGAYLAYIKATCSPANILIFFNALIEPLMTKLINANKMSSCCQEKLIR